jgi:Phospholipid methyltransferase
VKQYALTSQSVLHIPTAWNGYRVNTLLDYFVPRRSCLRGQPLVSIFRRSFNSARRFWVTLVHLAVLFGGTWNALAPVDAPKHLVVRGLYTYVRNPMYLSVATILIGEAILFLSTAIMIEAGIFMVLAYSFVVFYEEPTLRRQFGESYERYSQTVGRLIPRWRVSNRSR